MSVLATGTTISPSQVALSTAAYLRVASLSIAAYECVSSCVSLPFIVTQFVASYILTLAAEYRMYTPFDRKSLGRRVVLFVLIRYTSMVIMIVTNVGFFYHGFTPKSCGRYFYAAPVCKVLQVMVSHAILGIRTYNIARRNGSVGRTVLSAYFIAVAFEWFSAVANRIPQMADGNCMPASSHPSWPISTWSFFFAGMLYDCLTLSISTFYLLKARSAEVSAASGLVKILLYDGLIYFVALTAVNIMNIFFYRSTHHSIQSSGASLGYAITWIMSQRIVSTYGRLERNKRLSS
ncbi:hypothetical protein BJV78DRAFT_418407 [Lactifluus subvellereus]|nr:hypothetical protein BJV78DRAFT_418407 [Lactifluus subvellereus]